METGQFCLKRRPVKLREVLEEVYELHCPRAESSGVAFEYREEPRFEEVVVLADKNALLCVFANLVDNGIKYTGKGGRVEMRVELDDRTVAVSVSDTGVGMSPEEQLRCFDEFYRAKNEKTLRVPGTGLGLSVVKRLTELHGGRVMVRSKPGQGTVFTVQLAPETQNREA